MENTIAMEEGNSGRGKEKVVQREREREHEQNCAQISADAKK